MVFWECKAGEWKACFLLGQARFWHGKSDSVGRKGHGLWSLSYRCGQFPLEWVALCGGGEVDESCLLIC